MAFPNTGGSGTVTATRGDAGNVIFNSSVSGRSCTKFFVGNDDPSISINVWCEGMHDANDYLTLKGGTPSGEKVTLERMSERITKVIVWGASGTPAIRAGIVAD